MKIIFKAKQGAPFPDDKAQEVGEELIRISTDGELPVAADIVAAAQKKNSPLHDYFQWDDGAAGERWREHQARQMINHLIIVKENPDDGDVEIRAFFNVSKAEDEEDEAARRYVTIFSVLENEEYYQQVLKKALAELKTWQKKYQMIKELHVIFGLIEKTQKSLKF